MKAIFVVTVFQKIDHEPLLDDPSKYLPNFGERRCVGWFDNFQEADYAVINNFSNMHDDFYEYAIIEKIESGILTVDIDRVVYKWNSEKSQYEAIDTPVELSKSSNFGIG
ncbi:MAG: hypothetical protein IJZ79_01860 [Bacilli bacterium]|nr:hypothetical protein [Bacilli bacterium]